MEGVFVSIPNVISRSLLRFSRRVPVGHKIEKDREKQNIHSLIEDLATDTLNLQIVIDNFNKRIKH